MLPKGKALWERGRFRARRSGGGCYGKKGYTHAGIWSVKGLNEGGKIDMKALKEKKARVTKALNDTARTIRKRWKKGGNNGVALDRPGGVLATAVNNALGVGLNLGAYAT